MVGKTLGRSARLVGVTLGLLFSSVAPAVAAEPGSPAADKPPYRVGGEVTRPEKISGNPPVYTEMARKARLQGTVILDAILDEEGNVTEVRTLQGLPLGLDQAVVKAVQTWKFKPATLHGTPVKVYYTLTINFQVDSGSYGPLFEKFLREHPDFATAFGDELYDRAAAVLDGLDPRPAEPELTLARVHLSLGQGSLREAWQLAQDARDPGPVGFQEELWLGIAQSAFSKTLRAYGGARSEAQDLGLQAVAKVLEVAPNSVQARIVHRGFLNMEFRASADPAAKAELSRQIERLEEEIRTIAQSSLPPETRVGEPVVLATDGDKPLFVGGEVTAPVKISGDPPAYTEMARKARLQGVILLEVIVDEQGAVVHQRILKGLPMGLDKQALDGVKTWKFQPATLHGRPVKVYYTLTLDFRLPAEDTP
jgi:TonB family protein